MWLGSGEDGVMTWYNPSINICNRRGRGPFTGVNIWPKLSLYSPPQDIRGYPLPYLCTVRGVQTARAWNSKLKFASKNSAHLVYISPQHTAHYRHNSGLVPLKIAQLKGKQNPKRLNSWRKKKQEAYPQTYKAKSHRCRVQGGQYFRSHRRPKKLHLTQELTESL